MRRYRRTRRPLFEVAAQAEAVETEVAEAAAAGRRAPRALCAEFRRKLVKDGLVPGSLDTQRLAVVTDLLVCADSIVHLRCTRGWSATKHRRLIIKTLVDDATVG